MEVLKEKITKDSTHAQIEKIVMNHTDLEAGIGKIPHHDEIKKIFQPDSIQACMKRLDESKSDFGASV